MLFSQDLAFTINGNHEKVRKNYKFKIPAGTRIEEFEVYDGSYSV